MSDLKFKIVVPGDFPVQISGSPRLNSLKQYADVILYQDLPKTIDEQIARVQSADIIINSRGSVKWSGEILKQLPKLKLISTCSIGTDMIDLETAKKCRVIVSNVPEVTSPVVAEHAFGLILACAKRGWSTTNYLKTHGWTKMTNIYLKGKTIGIVGMGNTGSKLALMAKNFGMKVVAWTFHPEKYYARYPEIQFLKLKELLTIADVVSVHLKLSEDTTKMFSYNEFSMMKKGSIFINCARGPIIDTNALIDALNSDHLDSAGLDVFEEEPLNKDAAILQCENVILTPHCADSTSEGIDYLNEGTVKNVLAFIKGTPRNVVTPN